jgi:hypothetical protein
MKVEDTAGWPKSSLSREQNRTIGKMLGKAIFGYLKRGTENQ